MQRLPGLLEKIYQIRLAKYVGVTPDWFDAVHPEWEDAADIAMRLEAKRAKGPEVERWSAGSGKPLTLH